MISTHPLRPGASAPTFRIPSAPGTFVDLDDHLRRDKIVLLFYPLAFSSVCTSELCTIRDRWDAFESLGGTVLGISVDSPFVTSRFRADQGLPFPLLSDFNKDVSRAYGVLEDDSYGLKGVSKRAVFVIGTDGRIAWSWVAEDSGQQPSYEQIEAALSAAP